VDGATNCFSCRKHAGQEIAPPGGYLYEDERFLVCHAPAAMAVPGTLIVESRRHYLDFAEMTPEESARYGPLLAWLYAATKRAVGSEGVYALVTLEGAAHFHTWLIPRAPHVQTRGVAFLADELQCTEEEAIAAAEALRAVLVRPQDEPSKRWRRNAKTGERHARSIRICPRPAGATRTDHLVAKCP
jgi:diadenosine tetraphosphate (Ap4A) HIT family hydrolase